MQAALDYTFNFDELGGGLTHAVASFLEEYFFLQNAGPERNHEMVGQRRLVNLAKLRDVW